ncbi:MAG: S1C family serine protease [Dermatophilaceae bacterium]
MSSEGKQSDGGPWSPWERPAPSVQPGDGLAATHPAPPPPAYEAPHPHPPAPPSAPAWATQTAPVPTWPPASGDGAPGAESAPDRSSRRPGWGALIGTSLVVALFAGAAGGVVGVTLADGDSGVSRVRATVDAPRPGAGATARAEGTIANIAAKVTPSVVTLRVDGADGSGTGSGWVFDDNGHIVTNNHVVASAAESGKIIVALANGKQVVGTVVGRDASYDLAVVKVESASLEPITVGRSSDVVVGDQVIAVGAPLGLDSTVTTGIVSALDRPVTPGIDDDQSFINAIQTDAAINPGNSGGPLLDMAGRVIGVNTAIARVPGVEVSGQSGNIGVGFAIPSDQVATTVDQLIRTGKADHPVIGVYLDNQFDGEGVRIAAAGPDGAPAVNPGGPAADAGLRAGDVIVAFEGKPVTGQGELVVAIRARTIGDKVTLTVRRGGKDRDVTMVLKGSGD